MTNTFKFQLSTAMIFSLVATTATGQEMSPQDGDSMRVAAVPTSMGNVDDMTWQGLGELSLMSSQGNTDTLALGVSAEVIKNWPDWVLNSRAQFIRIQNSDVVTGESLGFGVRGARKFTHYELFSDNLYQRNEFAGYEHLYRFLLGIGVELVRTESQTLRIEAGPAYVIEDRVVGDTLNFAAASAQLLHHWKLQERVNIQTRAGYLADLENFPDSRYEVELGVMAPMSEMFSLKASYLGQYRSEPPVGVEYYDGRTMISLLASF